MSDKAANQGQVSDIYRIVDGVDGDSTLAALTGEVIKALGGRLALRPNELARTLGWSRSTAYAAVASGLIPSLLIGKTRVVPVASLVKLLHSANKSTAKN